MENYYEFLETDMTASEEDILSAIHEMASKQDADHPKIREIKIHSAE
ncbi:hypothetical protein ABC733_03405 [Mangrovibacter sp. SLW1]